MLCSVFSNIKFTAKYSVLNEVMISTYIYYCFKLFKENYFEEK